MVIIKLNGQKLKLSQRFISILLKNFGLNLFESSRLLSLHGLNSNILVYLIPLEFFHSLNLSLTLNYHLNNILFKNFKANLRFKKQLGTFKGLRLKYGLPSRGQRTHSNAKTAKRFLH